MSWSRALLVSRGQSDDVSWSDLTSCGVLVAVAWVAFWT